MFRYRACAVQPPATDAATSWPQKSGGTRLRVSLRPMKLAQSSGGEGGGGVGGAAGGGGGAQRETASMTSHWSFPVWPGARGVNDLLAPHRDRGLDRGRAPM